jgi:hypothetical protein
LWTAGYKYFFDIWNITDMTSLWLNFSLIMADWGGSDLSGLRSTRALAVIIMWWKFFYYLRLFHSTAPLVRMLFQIGSDMTVFSIVLAIAVLAFTNSFYILSLNRTNSGEQFNMYPMSFVSAIVYTYKTGLGDF